MTAVAGDSRKHHQEMLFLSCPDARRMEAAEEYAASCYEEAVKPDHPEWGIEWQEFLGGHLVFVARRSLVSEALHVHYSK